MALIKKKKKPGAISGLSLGREEAIHAGETAENTRIPLPRPCPDRHLHLPNSKDIEEYTKKGKEHFE